MAGNPNAIAYVSIGTAEYDATHGIPIKLLSLGTIQPSWDLLKGKDYPLSRPLVLVTKTSPTGLAKAFIEFATSPDAYDLVTHHYFVPLTS